MLQPLKGLLKTAVNRAGISTQVTSAQVIAAINAFLDAAVLRELRGRIQVASLAHGTLKIYCQNSVAAHEVRSLEQGIQEIIKVTDPRSDVRHILIQVHSEQTYDI